VTLINPKDGSVFASFGAHPSFEVALERTVTELLQGRSLDMLDDFHAPSFNMDEVADPNNLEAHFINSSGLLSYDFFKEQSDYDFVDWDHGSDTQKELEYLSGIIHDNGFDIYIADYEHLGVYACRILVPGMSDIYPVDDLLWSNNNEGARLREAILSLKELDKDELEALLEELEEGAFNDLQNVAEFIGVVPDKESHWAKLQIGELKAMIALAIGDLELAKEWNSWSLHISDLDEKRTLHHRCLQALLDIGLDRSKDYEEYAPSLELMYGKEILSICTDILSQRETFHGLHSPGLSLEGFKTHQKLLEGYAKLHAAKTKWT
jgi:ribosomal protein S12 methylthiotransferase accessory factor